LLSVTAVAQTKTFSAGEKAKVKGRITQRDVETFTMTDSAGATVVVLLTDTTSVKSNKKGLGLFRRGHDFEVTSLLRGLVVTVEGTGSEKGQLMAEKVRFEEADLKTAMTVESRVTPVEEANKKLAGQVDEVGAVAKDAKAEAAKANEGVAAANKRIDATDARISGLDNFDKQAETTVYFAVNSYVLTPEDKKALDELAQKSVNAKGYLIEVAGYADSTGDPEKNFALSQRRADTVVKYLAINGNIPMRRIVTPIGYGATKGVADDKTAEGRKQNRRVEVRLLVSRGLAQ
jgi:outer membrane protein OmpA-like peptidoglycan-associated protein